MNMKKHLLSVLAVLAIVGGGCSWMCTPPGGGSSPPDTLCCAHLAATPLPPSKLDQIIKAVQHSQYAENYRVGVWEHGKLSRTIGRMTIEGVEIPKANAIAKDKGLTAVTYRAGMGGGAFATCNPKTNNQMIDAKRLAQEVDKILKSP